MIVNDKIKGYLRA